LIHDVDHAGVPNAQLVKENDPVAVAYKNQSVLEQNSVDLAYDLVCSLNRLQLFDSLVCTCSHLPYVSIFQLMDAKFSNFRELLLSDEEEKKRFRQLVVNSVMATDIVDKELKKLRNDRWAKAFDEQETTPEPRSVRTNRKATIVIEHLIQSSDISHTMQHWHIYRKWNERFFMECYKAFKEGRAGECCSPRAGISGCSNSRTVVSL